MRSAFDTRAASFNPEQAAMLGDAYRLALKTLEASEHRLTTGTKSKLAKVVVNLGRECTRQRRALEPRRLSERAVTYIGQLRSLSLLD